MKKYQRFFCCCMVTLSLIACSKKIDISKYDQLNENDYRQDSNLPNYTHFWKDLNLFASSKDNQQLANLKMNMRQKIAQTMNYTDNYPIAYNGVPYSDDLLTTMTSTEPFNTGQLEGDLDNYKVEAVIFNTLASEENQQLVTDSSIPAYIGKDNNIVTLTTMTLYVRNMTNKPIIFNSKNALVDVSLGDYRLTYLPETYDKTHYILPNGYFHMNYLLVPKRLFTDKQAWVGQINHQDFEVLPNDVLSLYQQYPLLSPHELQNQLIADQDFLNMFKQSQLTLKVKNGKYIFNKQLQRKTINHTKLYQYLGENHEQ